MKIPTIALDTRIKRLWKASKILGVPIFDESLKDYNVYDLVLMEWLELFEDPRIETKYKNTAYDDDFNEYYNSDEYMPADPNLTKEEELELLKEIKSKKDNAMALEEEEEHQRYIENVHDEWEEL